MSAASSPHVIVIGGGVAGLASAVSLKRAGIASTVLEKGPRPLTGLRQIDPEMNLLSPEPLSRLPYMERPAPGTSGTYPTFRELVERFDRFQEKESIAVALNSDVTEVRSAPDGFEVTFAGPGATAHVVPGSHVINATGIVSRPVIPEPFERSGCRIPGTHSLQVRTDHLRDSRRLLVVGGGASAAEVLDRWLEIRRPDDVAWLSLQSRLKAVVSPILGVDLHYFIWLPEHLPLLGQGHKLASLSEPMNGRRVIPAIWRGLIRRVSAVAEYQAEQVRLESAEVVSPDLIVFATGFRYGTAHLGNLVERDPAGHPIVWRCESTRAKGLYLLGVRFGRSFASPYIRGIARDARFVARRIAASVGNGGRR